MSDQHPRTAMIYLLEELRLVINARPSQLSAVQVAAVLGELIADNASTVFTQTSEKK